MKRAGEAKEENEKAQTDEKANLKGYDEIISDYTGVDWNIAKANAIKHQDQKNSDVIAIGTNGKSVNMDLWEYSFDEETGGYGLNDEMSLKTTASSDASKGYLGDNFENIIIPQFIKINREAEWVSVTNLDWTFFNCSDLVRISKIPDTVKSMSFTFRSCNNLDEMPELPDSIENLMCTFFGTSIKTAKKVPNNVKKMYGTFVGCKLLENVTNIPEGCDDIQEIYYGSSSLNNVNIVIPGNVKKFYK